MFKALTALGAPVSGCGRPLTGGERLLAREVFGDAIDLDRPRIFDRCFLPLGQPRGLAMAPNGNVYFHPRDHVPDFARATLHRQGWFLHELTHVWQHQRGVRVWLRGLCDRRYRYLPLRPGKPFEKYGIEQQGDMVQDYFLLLRGCVPPGSVSLAAYRDLLPFRQPAFARLPEWALPGCPPPIPGPLPEFGEGNGDDVPTCLPASTS